MTERNPKLNISVHRKSTGENERSDCAGEATSKGHCESAWWHQTADESHRKLCSLLIWYFFHQTHFSLIQRKFNPLLLNKFDINLYNYSILELCKYSTVFLCKKTKIYYTKFIYFVKHKTLPNRITTNKKKKKLVFKQNWQNLQSTLTMRKIDFGNSLLLFNQRARIIFFQINISTNSYSK